MTSPSGSDFLFVILGLFVLPAFIGFILRFAVPTPERVVERMGFQPQYDPTNYPGTGQPGPSIDHTWRWNFSILAIAVGVSGTVLFVQWLLSPHIVARLTVYQYTLAFATLVAITWGTLVLVGRGQHWFVGKVFDPYPSAWYCRSPKDARQQTTWHKVPPGHKPFNVANHCISSDDLRVPEHQGWHAGPVLLAARRKYLDYQRRYDDLAGFERELHPERYPTFEQAAAQVSGVTVAELNANLQHAAARIAGEIERLPPGMPRKGLDYLKVLMDDDDVDELRGDSDIIASVRRQPLRGVPNTSETIQRAADSGWRPNRMRGVGWPSHTRDHQYDNPRTIGDGRTVIDTIRK